MHHRDWVLYLLAAVKLVSHDPTDLSDGLVIRFHIETLFVRECQNALILDPVVDLACRFAGCLLVPISVARFEHDANGLAVVGRSLLRLQFKLIIDTI